jgi:hypothetical protein
MSSSGVVIYTFSLLNCEAITTPEDDPIRVETFSGI